MGVKISCEYLGDLRVRATHGPSGTVLHTDAPVDNHGKGESFSPTDQEGIDKCMEALEGCPVDAIGKDGE